MTEENILVVGTAQRFAAKCMKENLGRFQHVPSFPQLVHKLHR